MCPGPIAIWLCYLLAGQPWTKLFTLLSLSASSVNEWKNTILQRRLKEVSALQEHEEGILLFRLGQYLRLRDTALAVGSRERGFS